MNAVTFDSLLPDGPWYRVRFDYDPDLVALIKQIPLFAREWWPDSKLWFIHADYVDWLVDQLTSGGWVVTGVGDYWARILLRRMGPDRANAVRLALVDILDPARPGDAEVFGEICSAYEDFGPPHRLVADVATEQSGPPVCGSLLTVTGQPCGCRVREWGRTCATHARAELRRSQP